MPGQHQNRKNGRGVLKILIFFWLGLYLLGVPDSDILHASIHNHPQVSHTEEQEKDPCHRSLYHDDVEQGCRHGAHLIASDKCALCDMTIHTDHALLMAVVDGGHGSDNTRFLFYAEDPDSRSVVISLSRAPPYFA